MALNRKEIKLREKEIKKFNKEKFKEYKKRKNRKNVPEQEYVTQMKDNNN